MDDHKGNLTLLAQAMTERDRYRDALIEIRDVAAISTGVGWYEMIANKALYPHTEVKISFDITEEKVEGAVTRPVPDGMKALMPKEEIGFDDHLYDGILDDDH